MDIRNSKPDYDKTWTLFLDRDGVINVESVGSYITSWGEFVFHNGVLHALRSLGRVFGNIVIVSNQRGVGKGVMTMDALREINKNMLEAIEEKGGRIDKIYAATAVADEDRNRKPNTGMGLQAQEDIPTIDFKKSVMIGNSLSDMEFGKRLSMHTIFLTTKHEPFSLPHDLIDEQFSSLYAWATRLIPAEMVG
jgi:D-glycero-D-manno-heptose 1,7-bisphosphate phosphatase